mmetsp:Transcript_150693/g.420043  ORF Transcript_150693/g.420043 Transcript_150693/m.420043 type:complete len:244 (-) Transcript_150693:155-886(-)
MSATPNLLDPLHRRDETKLEGVKLEVPFHAQPALMSCGPTALRMCFAFLDGVPDWDLQAIDAAIGNYAGTCISTIKLALAATRLGFQARFCSTHLSFNPDWLNNPYWQAIGDCDQATYAHLLEEARDAGVAMEERELCLDEILDGITPDMLPVVLVDMNVLRGFEGKEYCGHFMVVVGFSQGRDFVLVHQQIAKEAMPYQRIPAPLFDQARLARYTDSDVLFIKRRVSPEVFAQSCCGATAAP